MNEKSFTLYNKIRERYLKGDLNYFYRMRNHTDLSRDEKKLLDARTMFKAEQYEQAKNRLLTISTTTNFLVAEKNFLLATAYSYLTKFDKAIECNQLAYSIYKQIDYSAGCFLALYNQSVDYGRIKNNIQNEKVLLKAKKYANLPKHHALLLRALACKYSSQGNYRKACKFLEEIESNLKIFNPNDQISSLSVAADIYFRSGDWERSYNILNKLKNRTLNRNKAKIYFEYNILKALKKNKSLPAMPSPLKDSKEFSEKWNLLSYLETGQIEKARMLWNSLRTEYPQIFGQNFKLLSRPDNDSIFMSFLHRKISIPINQQTEEIKIKGKKAGKLLELLVSSPFPLQKEYLIEQVWQIPYHPDYNLRFYKLIERIKASASIKIINENSAYRLGTCLNDQRTI